MDNRATTDCKSPQPGSLFRDVDQMTGLWLSFRSKKRHRDIVSRQTQIASIARCENDLHRNFILKLIPQTQQRRAVFLQISVVNFRGEILLPLSAPAAPEERQRLAKIFAPEGLLDAL